MTYPEHERDARTRGVPALGSGLVFPIADEEITVDSLPIAEHWPRIHGLDFGFDHPFAAVSIAHDRDADCVYVTHAYREARSTPILHAAALKPWGTWVPCAWPQDGLQHDKGSGKELASLYRNEGLNLLKRYAEWEDGGTGVEAGVIGMLDRMQTGRFKVFRHLTEWFAEKRHYHRKNGRIVKERDDLLCATRYALMMLREASTKPKLYKRMPLPSGVTHWSA
jgi:hypothetical protein